MKSLICSACLAASLALTGNAAMAATTHVIHKTAKAPVTHAHAAAHVVHAHAPAQAAIRRAPAHFAVRSRYPRGNLSVDIGQFITSMLSGGPVQYAQLVRDVGALRGARSAGSSASYSPSYDSAPPIDNGAGAAAQQALDEANQLNTMNSMQAAQEQNDAANAATNAGIAAAVQTEINANQ